MVVGGREGLLQYLTPREIQYLIIHFVLKYLVAKNVNVDRVASPAYSFFATALTAPHRHVVLGLVAPLFALLADMDAALQVLRAAAAPMGAVGVLSVDVR